MSIPDELMGQWLRLAANLDEEQASDIETRLASGTLHPNEAKRHLARTVVGLYWGEDAAGAAENAFDTVFKKKGTPDDVAEFQLPSEGSIHIPTLIRDVFGMSGTEARRMIDQGAVRLDDVVVSSQELSRRDLTDKVLKVGKRRFARLVG
jgi:tyrosyl-tRNA synthetase